MLGVKRIFALSVGRDIVKQRSVFANFSRSTVLYCASVLSRSNYTGPNRGGFQ